MTILNYAVNSQFNVKKAVLAECPLRARSSRLYNLGKLKLFKDKFHFLGISAFTLKITFKSG